MVDMQRLLVPGIVLALVLPPSQAVRAEAPAEEKGGVRLSLAECQRTALENNLDLVIKRKDPRIAASNAEVQAASFDPLVEASVNHSESRDEPSAVFQSQRSMVDEASVSWKHLLKFGGSYSMTLSGDKVDAPNPFRLYNPSYESRLAAQFTFPLLRGLGREATTVELVLARSGEEISREELRQQADRTLETVEGAYWDLVAAREALKVARKSLQLAQDLHQLNKKKVEVGTLAPIEITQAEAGVAAREEAVIVAETALLNAEDNLRGLLAWPKEDPRWNEPIFPTDNPSLEPPPPLEAEAAISRALEARPEMMAARRDLRNKELSERVARNGVRPGLDLTAGVTPSGNNLKDVVVDPGPNGIPGDGDDVLLPLTDGLGESLSEIPDFRNYTWNVGLVFSVPLRNRAAKASYGVATLNREKAEIGLLNLEQTVRVEVRTAIRGVESGTKRVAAARSNVALQRKKLEAEQKKFENGMSTSFEVLTFQNDLGSAELAEIRALADYNKALATLERAQGTLLEARGMRLENEGGR